VLLQQAEPKTVETILMEGGFRPFHRRVVAITGFSWSFVAMEILLIAFTLPLFQNVWSLSGFMLGVIGAAALIGSFIGSLIWGRLADRLGRRPIFQSSILWYSVFTGLTAAAWDPTSLFAFRLLAGLGLGGMLVVDPSLLAEYLPPQVRGRFLVFLDFFWPLGFAGAIGMSFYFLEVLNGAWRLMFITAAFPAFLAFVFRLTIPESPFFLARRGRKDKAAQVLTRITGRQVQAETIAEEKGPVRGKVQDLFARGMSRSTAVIIVTWIALNFSYYGLFLWLPSALQKVVGLELGNIYIYLLLSAVAQFPGYLTSMWLVEAWGRKKTLATFLGLGGVSGFIFAIATTYESFILGLFFVSFFNLGAWGAVYPFTSETFPTVLRATGFGLAEGVGKITAIMGPTVFGILLDVTGGILAPLLSVALVMVVGSLVAQALGRETRGIPLT